MLPVTSRHVASICKSIRDVLASTHWTYNGQDLDRRDLYRVREGFTMMWIMWSEALNGYSFNPVGQLEEWLRLIPHDVRLVIDTLKAADEQVLQYYEQDLNPARWREFKAHLREKGFNSAGLILGPLKPLYPCVFLNQETDYTRLRLLRSCLMFLSRLNLTGEKLGLKEETFQKWMATEERIGSSAPDPGIKRFFVDRLAGWHLKDVKPADFQHGSGHCADTFNELEAKYLKFGVDSGVLRIWEECQTQWPISRCCNMAHGPDYVSVYGACDQLRISRQSAVPKSYSSYRMINLEPAHCMFMQKGIQASLYRYVKNDPYLSRHCMVDDNSLNRAYCYHASRSGYFVTIDLSAASDSITRQQLFTWTKDTDLFRAWWYTASRRVRLLDGTIYKPKKAFSMGSAVCFPYEVFCFSAIVENSIRALGVDPESSFYVIHGDDIIVEREFASEVVRQLEENGFIVNKEKSFFGNGRHIFRESCGVEYLDGHDIKPLKISRRFFDTLPPEREKVKTTKGCKKPRKYKDIELTRSNLHKSDPSWVPRFIDLANRAFGLFKWLRQDAINALSENGVAVAFTSDIDDSSKIFSYAPTNFHLVEEERVAYYYNRPIVGKLPDNRRTWYKTYQVYHRYRKELGKDVHTSDPTRLYEVLRRMEMNKDRFITIDMVDPDRVVNLDSIPWKRYSPDPAEAGSLVRSRLDGED